MHTQSNIIVLVNKLIMQIYVLIKIAIRTHPDPTAGNNFYARPCCKVVMSLI